MAKFGTIRAAKNYLAGQIADEAKRQSVALTEVERKMLYFSETGSTLPDMMKVSEEFDRDYDQDEYEAKIAGLVRGIEARDETRSEEDREDWYEAVLKLCDGDHYLLTLIDAGSAESKTPSLWRGLDRWFPVLDGSRSRPRGDFARLILSAFALLLVIGSIAALLTWLFGPDWSRWGNPPRVFP